MNSKEFFFDQVVQEVYRGTPGPIRVLELGCGTARYVPAMITKYPDMEYFGIEPIDASFKKAQEILKDVPRTKVVFQFGYDSIEGLQENSFDMVISFSVLEHVKQLDRFMDLSARYVKQGGLMVHRYDLGHALYPGSFKERVHVLLGNTFPSVLPETKFVRYVSLQEVEANYQRLGITSYRHTYHQMPNHKSLEKVLGDKSETVMEDVYTWEFKNADTFSAMPLSSREKLFPTVAVWGRKE